MGAVCFVTRSKRGKRAEAMRRDGNPEKERDKLMTLTMK
jgi:hypothetical protein